MHSVQSYRSLITDGHSYPRCHPCMRAQAAEEEEREKKVRASRELMD